MKEMIVFLTLLGCDDAERQCTTFAHEPTAFMSLASCEAAADRVLREPAFGDGHPLVIAQCRPVPQITQIEPQRPLSDDSAVHGAAIRPAVAEHDLSRHAVAHAARVAERVVDGVTPWATWLGTETVDTAKSTQTRLKRIVFPQ